MPIRTNRGRAAVYRRLWGWPLRSPKHLFATAVVVVVLAVAIAIVTANATSSRRASAAPRGNSDTITTPVLPSSVGAQPGDTPSSGAPSATQTRLTTPPEQPASAKPGPAALSVITAWGNAWVHHPVGMTNAQWLAQLKPYTTDEFLPQMSSVDVANIDATQVTGPPQPTKSFTSSLEALLPTNAGKLDITAIATPTGWLVTSYTEAAP